MELPKRKPNRLKCYDYSTPGAYFVTICTQNKKCILSRIVGDGFPVPYPVGQIAEAWIRRIPEKYPSVSVDKYIVMPNHVHMLLRMEQADGTGNPSPTLGAIIAWYKYQATQQINECCGTAETRFFQRSYHDHIIRGEQDYLKIWEYIDTNPVRWKDDCFYVEEHP